MRKVVSKIIDKIKNNWYFILLIIPLIPFCITNRTPDNDIWFLLNNGRYVFNHWIPYIDPFTIHEGLNYVMQQWLSSLIFYVFYKIGGKYGLLTLMFVLYLVINFIYYKLCYLNCKNKKYAVIITTIMMFFTNEYIVTRPQCFSYIIFLLEIFLMESYIKKEKIGYLVAMPLLSFLLINLHASMWLLQFVFMLPFLCNVIKIKKITIDRIKFKPVLITLIIMFIVGFINPYGWNAITFVFKTYGIEEINTVVTEMLVSNFNMYHYKVDVLLFLGYMFVLYVTKKKVDIRYILLLCGTFLFSSMHGKCLIYFILFYGYIFSDLIKDIKLPKIKVKRIFINLLNGLCIGLFGCLLYTLFFTTKEVYKQYRMETNYVYEIADYLDNNYDSKSMVLYTGFVDGGFFEFRGYKTYIDPRAELFFKKLNKKEDIFLEYTSLDNDKDIAVFLEKYNFTHLVINKGSKPFYEYMLNNDDYICEYTEYYDSNKNNEAAKLFVRKDVSKVGGDEDNEEQVKEVTKSVKKVSHK